MRVDRETHQTSSPIELGSTIAFGVFGRGGSCGAGGKFDGGALPEYGHGVSTVGGVVPM